MAAAITAAIEGSEEPAVKPGRLALSAGGVRDGVVEALQGVIEHSIEAASSVQEDRVRAIHEFRKSVRRARAVLALCREQIPADQFRALWCDLRDAARPTSHLRDADVFAAVLASVDVPDRLTEAAERIRTSLSSAPDDVDGVSAVLVAGATKVRGVPERFDQALPSDLDWDAVEQGLRRSYRAARRRLKKTLKSRSIDDYHDWRKRTKELTYQLELLTEGLDGEVAELRKDFSDFSTELGTVTDRVNLADRLLNDAEDVDDELHEAAQKARAARKRWKKAPKKTDERRAAKRAFREAEAGYETLARERKQARKLAKTVRREAETMLSKAVAVGEAMFQSKPKRFARATIEGVLAARRAEQAPFS